jgi:hypothetical protein
MHHHTTAGLGPRSPENALIIPVMRRGPFTGVDPIHPCESVHRTGRGKACLAPTPLPGHVTVVTPWRPSLPRKSPPLPGHTTVAVPCPDGPGDHREMFRHRDRMRSSGPVASMGLDQGALGRARHALPLHRCRVMSTVVMPWRTSLRANPPPSLSGDTTVAVRVRMVGATIGKCLVTGIECDHRDRYGTPGHVTVVTPWRTSLPRKSPPLPGHTTVIGPHRVRHQTTE